MPKSDMLARYPELKQKFESLEELSKRHLATGAKVLEAGGGALYATDHVVLGALKRSLDIVEGTSLLVRNWNFIAAAPLLRAQLDTLLRLVYIARCGFPDAFSQIILTGKLLSKVKDAAGKPLTDARLRDYARPIFPWLDKVYEETSRMVHYSEKHFMLMVEKAHEGETSADIVLQSGQPNWPLGEIHNFVDALTTATKAILDLAEGWAGEKDRVQFRRSP